MLHCVPNRRLNGVPPPSPNSLPEKGDTHSTTTIANNTHTTTDLATTPRMLASMYCPRPDYLVQHTHPYRPSSNPTSIAPRPESKGNTSLSLPAFLSSHQQQRKHVENSGYGETPDHLFRCWRRPPPSPPGSPTSLAPRASAHTTPSAPVVLRASSPSSPRAPAAAAGGSGGGGAPSAPRAWPFSSSCCCRCRCRCCRRRLRCDTRLRGDDDDEGDDDDDGSRLAARPRAASSSSGGYRPSIRSAQLRQ